MSPTNTQNKSCSICEELIEIKTTSYGAVYWRGGNNAQPINDGQCCDVCNDKYVIPARLEVMFG